MTQRDIEVLELLDNREGDCRGISCMECPLRKGEVDYCRIVLEKHRTAEDQDRAIARYAKKLLEGD